MVGGVAFVPVSHEIFPLALVTYWLQLTVKVILLNPQQTWMAGRVLSSFHG